MNYQKYLYEFEKQIICSGFASDYFKKRKEEIVPLRYGKLSKSEFGEFIGKTFNAEILLAINYYGLFKLSTEIIRAAKSVNHIFGEVRSIKSQVIHFNSIRIEDVKNLAPELVIDYPEFKKYIVGLRWGEERQIN